MANTQHYRGFRYPRAIISHVVWLYFRFPLSFRDIEDIMASRGVIVTYPNSYAYYGADPAFLSFGVFRWITNDQSVLKLSASSLLAVCKYLGTNYNGGRTILMPKGFELGGQSFFFMPSEQETPGDGTVSQQSGDGPRGKVKRVFRTTGYDHQGSYDDKNMVSLTFHLIAKIAQEAK